MEELSLGFVFGFATAAGIVTLAAGDWLGVVIAATGTVAYLIVIALIHTSRD